MKISIILMIAIFTLLLISVIGMLAGSHFFEEIHGILGGIFITLIFVHLYFNRFFIKNMFKKK